MQVTRKFCMYFGSFWLSEVYFKLNSDGRFVPRNAPWRIHPHSCLSPPNALVRKKWLTLADQPATPRIRLLPIHTFS